MTLSKADAQAEAEGICDQINGIEGASARYDHRSDGTGRKYLFVTATLEYQEEEP